MIHRCRHEKGARGELHRRLGMKGARALDGRYEYLSTYNKGSHGVWRLAPGTPACVTPPCEFGGFGWLRVGRVG